MDLKQLFKDPNTIKLWESYFKRVDKIISVLDNTARDETRMEIQNHLYESYREQDTNEEVTKLLSAIEQLGDPEDYLKHTVSEKLLKKATRSLLPQSLLRGLLYNFSGGLKYIMRSAFFIVAYILIFIFGLMSLTKFFMPEHVGLFLWPDGTWNFGIISHTLGATELLDFWIVPIALMVAFILYYVTTQLLKLTLKKE